MIESAIGYDRVDFCCGPPLLRRVIVWECEVSGMSNVVFVGNKFAGKRKKFDDDDDDENIGESRSSEPPKDVTDPSIGQEFYPVYQERCDNAIASANKYKRDNVDVTSPDAIFLLQPLYEQGLIPNMGSFDIKPYLNVSAFCMRRLCNVLCQKGMALTINESLKAIGGGRISVRGWINRDPLYLVKRAEGESIVKHGEDD